MKKWELPRRTFLRGLGTAIALPYLECMTPWLSRAAAAGLTPALRFVVLYKPNGEYPGSWNIQNGVLPYVLAPLAALKNEVTFINGLRNNPAAQYNDGHAPKLSCFLTGGPIQASTSVVKAPKSIDQIIATARGKPALTISGPYDYGTDNGFNGEYFSNLSWNGPRAAPKINRPGLLFDKIFASQNANQNQQQINIRDTYKKSILDFALEDATRLRTNLGKSDQMKLDEYLTSIRELEKNIQSATPMQQCSASNVRPSDQNAFVTHTKLMLDLLVKALQCGHSDVATYLFDTEVGYGYQSHHAVSHFTENAGNPQKYMDCNRFYVSQLAYFLDQLQKIQDSDGTTLLNNTAVLYGGGLGNGDSHSASDLPIILAGRAQGKLMPGRVLNKPNQRLANLMLTLLQLMGVNQATLGDSNGTFADL